MGDPGDALDPAGLDRRVDLDAVLQRIVDQVTRRLGADRGTLYLVDRARGELVSRVAHLPEISEIRLRMGEGAAGHVAATGVPAVIGPNDPGVARRVDAVTGYQTHTLLAVPVMGHQGAVVGVIQLLNKPRGFSDSDQDLLAQLADEVAALLDRTSLGPQLRADQRQPLSFRFNHIVGDSAVMQQVYERTARAAGAKVTVLVRGESGSGKELVARAIHENSARASGPFIKVDCAALPPSLIENELFGHVRGAFTGAVSDAAGLVAQADGGTLFLDEVGELPLKVQAKLLRLLQDQSWLQVGGTRAHSGDLRIVCATHVDLEAAIAARTFRQDLYYRMRVIEIRVPPLRSRGGGDLDRLIDHFLWTYARKHRRERRFSDAARARLHAHSWPGNVRELEHCIEAAVVLSDGPVVPAEVLALSPAAPVGPRFETGLEPLREVEQRYVQWVLERCDGNRSEAARRLEIGRNTLARKLSD